MLGRSSLWRFGLKRLPNPFVSTTRNLVLLFCALWPTRGLPQNLNEELLAAARKGDSEVVKALLDQGADVNAKSRYGVTPLYFAASRGHAEVVKLLLGRGADLNAKDTFYHWTALATAAWNAHIRVVRMLLDAGAEGKDQVLLVGTSRGNAELARVALERGGLKDEVLSIALGTALRNNNSEITEMLKKAGAAPPPKGDFPVEAGILKTYLGTFTNKDGSAVVRINMKDGKLSAEHVDWGEEFFLGAVNPTTFRALDFEGLLFEFHVEAGKAVGFTLKPYGEGQEFRRVEVK